MDAGDREDELLRSVALRNASAILLARQRAEEELVRAKDALESRTRELAHSLSLMQATFESTADAILVTDLLGKVLVFNQRFLEVWGLPEEAVRDGEHQRLVHSVRGLFRDPDQVAATIQRVYASGGMELLDTLELLDGRVYERFSRPQVVDGVAVGRVWSYRDITARRHAEEALRDEARVLDLLNRTGTAIASTLDLSTLLQTVTDAATQMSGAQIGAFFYNTTDGSGDAFALYALSGAPREAFDSFGHPRATPLFGPTFRGEAPVRCDDVLADPRYGGWGPHHGIPRDHPPVRSYLGVPVTLRHGETVGGLFFGHARPGVFTARTERLMVGIASQAAVAIDNARLYEEAKRVALERERLVDAERAARADIARVSRLKDEFLATLSHELRTPLTAVLGWARVLLRKKDDAETMARGLDTIERNATAQAQLIEDLLDMNRIISGKVRLDVQPTDVARVVEAAIDAIGPSADAKGIRVRTVLDPGAGPVAGDPNRLQQVVWNLLTNAVKFTPRGGKVDIVLERVNSHLELAVTDSGMGVAPEFLPHVFDRFRQADSSTTRSHGGLGLGLSIVKQLVELHGGSVRALSEGEGRGATFVVCLPLAALRGDAPRAHPTRSGVVASLGVPVDLTGVKVLVVDDEPDAREVIKQLLTEYRAEVHMAGSVSEALAAVQSLRPDVVLSDIGMPERDGYHLIGAIRRLPPERGGRTPAIALTAFARSEDRTRAMLAGYQVHVAKPIEPHELVATVASLVGRMAQPEA
ncbi:MAG TPA: ATP-binding protein [Albitalea sp.]|nr:ATP-binding protein [Albitalea sp.]